MLPESVPETEAGAMPLVTLTSWIASELIVLIS